MALYRKENIIDGCYTVQYLIKESKYSETYKVKDKDDVPLFLKLYKRNSMPVELIDPKKGFMPAALAVGLNHPNVLGIMRYDFVMIDEQTRVDYIVTPYFNGELLEEKMYRTGPLPTDEAVHVFKGILLGLQYIHNQELPLIHNDITPRNVLLTEDGAVKIIDLGHLSHEKNKAGVPSFDVEDLNAWYQANETLVYQFNKKTDIFAATAVFYTMLFGFAPWNPPPVDGTRIQKFITLIKMRGERGELDFSSVKLTEKYREILRKGLSLIPQQRYKDISEILADLDKPDISSTPVAIPKDPDYEKKEQPMEPPKGFAAIAGMKELKKMLADRVMFVLRNKRKAEQYKLTPPNGMLLYGPPGCGKTFFAEKFAEECGYNFMMTRMSNIGSTLVHGTEENIAKLFEKAKKDAPTVLCFDVPSRTTYEGRNQAGEVNEFLTHLNNCGQRGIFVVATSNRPDMIDSAVLRTGRIDRQIYVPLPDAEARQELFRMYLKGRPCGKIDVEALGNMTEGYIASDIAYICNEAAMVACLNDRMISQEILDAVLQGMRPSIRPDIIKMYDDIKNKMEGLNRKNALPKIGFV